MQTETDSTPYRLRSADSRRPGSNKIMPIAPTTASTNSSMGWINASGEELTAGVGMGPTLDRRARLRSASLLERECPSGRARTKSERTYNTRNKQPPDRCFP